MKAVREKVFRKTLSMYPTTNLKLKRMAAIENKSESELVEIMIYRYEKEVIDGKEK